jgi:hypothetical protein
MSTKYRIIAASEGLLAIVFALLLTGRLSAGEDDAKAEKAVEALGGKIERNPNGTGRPIISVDLGHTKVSDKGLKELCRSQELGVPSPQ